MGTHRPDLSVRTLASPMTALGVAAHFVARHAPFDSFPAGALMRTLSGEIDRGHYRLALEGRRVVGYLGWALYTTATAERFAATGRPPLDADEPGASVVWVLTAVSARPDALLALYRAVRAAHPGLLLMAMRHKPGGRRVVVRRRLPP